MIDISPQLTPVLAALRDPPASVLLFTLSLPEPAAIAAAEALAELHHCLRRHGRQGWASPWSPQAWREGQAACTGPEAAVLRLLATRDAFLARSLAAWLVRPPGQAALLRAAACLARAVGCAASFPSPATALML